MNERLLLIYYPYKTHITSAMRISYDVYINIVVCLRNMCVILIIKIVTETKVCEGLIFTLVKYLYSSLIIL